MRCLSFFLSLAMLATIFATSFVLAATINVPAQQPTIQDGINAASNGDTVLVAPGIYLENINFFGKAITVTSSGGPAVTAIGAFGGGVVVRFSSGEGNQSVLSGFTIRNGTAAYGAGIYVFYSAPVIKRNRIINNDAMWGGGIYVGGFLSPGAKILGNAIKANHGAYGAGIALDAAGSVTIENNKISNNTSDIQGGAIWMVNEADEIIVQNYMAADVAPSGTEIYSSIPMSATGFRLVNNTIVSTNPNADAAVIADGFNANAEIINNVIVAAGSQTALLCNPIFMDGPAIVQFNDAFSAIGTSYGGMCTGFSGTNGNISASPDFVNQAKGNFQLQNGSPAINVGTNSAPNLPKKDLAGKTRIVGGTIDIGAYENQTGAADPE